MDFLKTGFPMVNFAFGLMCNMNFSLQIAKPNGMNEWIERENGRHLSILWISLAEGESMCKLNEGLHMYFHLAILILWYVFFLSLVHRRCIARFFISGRESCVIINVRHNNFYTNGDCISCFCDDEILCEWTHDKWKYFWILDGNWNKHDRLV